MLIEESVVVEAKALDALHPVHTAQLLTYLRFSERRLMKEGIKRLVL